MRTEDTCRLSRRGGQPLTPQQRTLRMAYALRSVLWTLLLFGALMCYGGFFAILGTTLEQSTGRPPDSWWLFGPAGLAFAWAMTKVDPSRRPR